VEVHSVVRRREPAFSGHSAHSGEVSLTRRPDALYPQEDSWYSYCWGLSQPQGHSAAGTMCY
jgi:hypothetical protein